MKFTDFKIIIILIISFAAGIWAADIFFNGVRNPLSQDKPFGQGEQGRSEGGSLTASSDPSPGESGDTAQSSGTPVPSPSPKASLPAATPEQVLAIKDVLLNVPFSSQAPFGNWKDPKEQDGCEEASAMMAMAWVKGETLTKDAALIEITAIADYEEKNYGNFHDTDAEDTAKWIFKGYFGYSNIEVKHDITTSDIVQELLKGNLVIVPTNGRKLGNPYYTPPGPIEHNLVIRGYDTAKKEFITNDSGTSYGEKFRYKESVLQGALMDYPTGDHAPITETKTAMIVVKK